MTIHSINANPRHDRLVRETLHLATFGSEDSDAIIVGIRYLPVSKLILITMEGSREAASIFAGRIGGTLKLQTEVYEVRKPLLYNTLVLFRKILEREAGRYEDIIVSVSSGDKQLSCAALTATFINGLKTIAVDGNVPVLLPIIRMSYQDVISDAKLNILKALERAGGSVRDLTMMSKLTGYGKPLLSYHINGSEDSKGLLELGLVEISRKRGEGQMIRTISRKRDLRPAVPKARQHSQG